MAYKEQRPADTTHISTHRTAAYEPRTNRIYFSQRHKNKKGKAQPQATDNLAKGGANVPLAAGITLIRSQTEM